MNNNLQMFEGFGKNPWSAVYTQGGMLNVLKNTSIKACSVSHLLILSDEPLWIYVEDIGEYKEVDLRLNSSVDEEFGQKEHEILFRPPRIETVAFPSCCRIDLFLSQSLSVMRMIKQDECRQLLTGVVLENGRGDCLGFFVDEDIPTNLILTTDSQSIDELCRVK